MSILKWEFPKDPGSDLDYICDWSKWLEGDTIVISNWAVPVGLVSSGNSNTSEVTTIWLADGIDGGDYILTNSITTAGGRTEERDIQLQVKNR